MALIEWEADDFPPIRQTEIDAVAQQIIGIAELLKRMRESRAELNGFRSHHHVCLNSHITH